MIYKERIFSLIIVFSLLYFLTPLLNAQELAISDKGQEEPHTVIGVNVGMTICSGIEGPELTVGLFDLGGSRAGVEFGGYVSPKSYFTWGVDASFMLRLVTNLYAKAGIGTFCCKDRKVEIGAQEGTLGLCPGLGLTYVIGRHLNLGVYSRFMPETRIRSNSMISTSVGKEYPFAEEVVAINRGLAPSVTIGWIF